MQFRVTPLEIMLCVDSLLISVPLFLVALEQVNPGGGQNANWALRAGAALGLGFLALRNKARKDDPRPPSSNPARRVGGLLVMAVGGTVAVLGFLGAYAILTEFKSIGDLVWLAVPAVPVLLGSAGIYAGAAIRAPAISEKA